MSGLPESGHMAGIGGRLKPTIAVIAPFAERSVMEYRACGSFTAA
jgi:hypothetical protein